MHLASDIVKPIAAATKASDKKQHLDHYIVDSDHKNISTHLRGGRNLPQSQQGNRHHKK